MVLRVHKPLVISMNTSSYNGDQPRANKLSSLFEF